MKTCPKCQKHLNGEVDECPFCGIIISKFNKPAEKPVDSNNQKEDLSKVRTINEPPRRKQWDINAGLSKLKVASAWVLNILMRKKNKKALLIFFSLLLPIIVYSFFKGFIDTITSDKYIFENKIAFIIIIVFIFVNLLTVLFYINKQQAKKSWKWVFITQIIMMIILTTTGKFYEIKTYRIMKIEDRIANNELVEKEVYWELYELYKDKGDHAGIVKCMRALANIVDEYKIIEIYRIRAVSFYKLGEQNRCIEDFFNIIRSDKSDQKNYTELLSFIEDNSFDLVEGDYIDQLKKEIRTKEYKSSLSDKESAHFNKAILCIDKCKHLEKSKQEEGLCVANCMEFKEKDWTNDFFYEPSKEFNKKQWSKWEEWYLSLTANDQKRYQSRKVKEKFKKENADICGKYFDMDSKQFKTCYYGRAKGNLDYFYVTKTFKTFAGNEWSTKTFAHESGYIEKECDVKCYQYKFHSDDLNRNYEDCMNKCVR